MCKKTCEDVQMIHKKNSFFAASQKIAFFVRRNLFTCFLYLHLFAFYHLKVIYMVEDHQQEASINNIWVEVYNCVPRSICIPQRTAKRAAYVSNEQQ